MELIGCYNTSGLTGEFAPCAGLPQRHARSRCADLRADADVNCSGLWFPLQVVSNITPPLSNDLNDTALFSCAACAALPLFIH